jgi:DNA-binding NtrC family response regulator
MEPAAVGSNHRVLIVDDEVTIRIALRRFFVRMGWSVEEAANGDAALDLVAHDQSQVEGPRFSLIVSDLRMPGLNGMEMYDQLKARHPAVLRRLIFSTGDIVSEEAATFVRSTECVVLQKPFELAALREVVDRVIAQDAS